MSPRRGGGWALVVASCAFSLGACVSAAPAETADGPPVVRWSATPDRADLERHADSCTEASAGAYQIDVELLAEDFADRREQLVQRLTARDPGIDLISIDTALTPELAGGNLLASLPAEIATDAADGTFDEALDLARHEGALVALPWWIDPQLLWYRTSVAERAGLDMTKPVTWSDLVDGAQRAGTTIQIDDQDGQGLSAWVDSLIAGRGARTLSGPGRTPDLGLASSAGRDAATIIETYVDAGVGPGPADGAVDAFGRADGGFLLAATSVVSEDAIGPDQSDLGWTTYPLTTQGAASAPPLTGMNLAVSAHSREKDVSFDAAACLSSSATQESLMLTSGHGASRASVFDDPQVEKSYPMAEVARSSIESGESVPQSPYWSSMVEAIGRTWSPLGDVGPASTPRQSEQLAADLIAGRLP